MENMSQNPAALFGGKPGGLATVSESSASTASITEAQVAALNQANPTQFAKGAESVASGVSHSPAQKDIIKEQGIVEEHPIITALLPALVSILTEERSTSAKYWSWLQSDAFFKKLKTVLRSVRDTMQVRERSMTAVMKHNEELQITLEYHITLAESISTEFNKNNTPKFLMGPVDIEIAARLIAGALVAFMQSSLYATTNAPAADPKIAKLIARAAALGININK
jgi:hypothetical protein